MLRGLLFVSGVAGGALATSREGCEGNATCFSQQEDSAMVQLAGVALRHGGPRKQMYKSFAQNSKPFLGGSGGGALTGGEEGKLVIDEDGAMNTYYLPGATTLDDGKTVKFTPPYRFYLMRSPTTDYSNADNFYKPDFAGKTFTVDINFGGDGASCGCNLNFYLVDMPVPQAGQDNDHYCDAQCFPGLGCCSEFDMNEGNNEVQQMTNHACTHDYGGHPDWQCNKWGDPELKTHGSDFSSGGQSTIDSKKPFTYSQRFEVENGDFAFTTTISQEGRQTVLKMGPGSSQLNAMFQVIQKGMAFVTGYWFAQDMNWMDGELCGSGPEHCNQNPAYISNWRLTSNSGPVPSPAPAPTPAPGPGPAPAPSPVPGPGPAGKCCWGPQCSDCKEDSNNWCNQGVDNCWQCTGGWCPA